MSDAAYTAPVLALVRDLIFASRITATASSLDVMARLIRNPHDLGTQPGRRLLVDLNLPGAIEAASEWSRATGGDVVGFVAHVDAPTVGRARAAGILQVMARSRFVEVLPDLLECGDGTPDMPGA